MKALVKSPTFWIVLIIISIGAVYAFKKGRRKILLVRIEERFGKMAGLDNKTSEELQQILNAK